MIPSYLRQRFSALQQLYPQASWKTKSRVRMLIATVAIGVLLTLIPSVVRSQPQLFVSNSTPAIAINSPVASTRSICLKYERSFCEGLFSVRIDGKYGFIDKSGKIVIQPQFERVDSFSEGLACVRIGNKFGFIDRSGKIVIKPQFQPMMDELYDFSEGLANVPINGKFGYIDKSGNIVISPQFED